MRECVLVESARSTTEQVLLSSVHYHIRQMQKVLVLRYARVRELTNLWRAGDVAAVVAALSAQPAESGEQAQPDPAADALLADFLNSIESRYERMVHEAVLPRGRVVLSCSL